MSDADTAKLNEKVLFSLFVLDNPVHHIDHPGVSTVLAYSNQVMLSEPFIEGDTEHSQTKAG